MNIYQAIHGVMSDVGAIGKDRKNQQQGFMYRGVDEVMNALQPAFVRHNIFVVPEVLEQTREERQSKTGGQLLYSILKVKFTFYAEDGSSVSATVVGEGMDSADKASNKAMSVAFKYACFQVFCIPTEEMVDPDSETPPQSTQQNTPTPPPKNKVTYTPPEDIAQSPKAPQSPQPTVTREQQVAQLIKGTSLTLAKVGEWIVKKFGKTMSLDELSSVQYTSLLSALSAAVDKELNHG